MIWRYAIAYYETQGANRVPLPGLDVRLVRPGGSWPGGLPTTEVAPGYYEASTADAAECGYYEIWDNATGLPRRTGKTAVIGPLDAPGIAEAANFLTKITEIKQQLEAFGKVHGCDIFIQGVEPPAGADYIWIDTSMTQTITR